MSERIQIMLLITVGGWIGWAIVFLMTHFGPRSAPSAIRPAIRWVGMGTMLICASITLGVAADQYGWTRIHRTVGGIGLALVIAGLICMGVGLLKVRRRSRADRDMPVTGGMTDHFRS